MNNNKLPLINSEASLQVAIQLMKERIKMQEEALGSRIQQIPGEMLKSVTGSILPSIISLSTIGSIWSLLKMLPIAQSLFSLIRKKSKD